MIRALGLILVWELSHLLSRIEVWLPLLFSASLALFSLGGGYRTFGGDEAKWFVTLGFVTFATVSGTLLHVFQVIVFTRTQSLLYWASLPYPLEITLGAKLTAGAILGTLIASLAYGLFLGRAPKLQDLAVLFLVALGTVGIVALFSAFLPRLDRLAGLSVVLGVFFQYLSTVYLPLEAFPTWARPFVLLNPVSQGANALRGEEASGLLLIAPLSFLLGIRVLAHKARKQVR
jgi:ABC-type polysaccharide/polyol phosphate export permease